MLIFNTIKNIAAMTHTQQSWDYVYPDISYVMLQWLLDSVQKKHFLNNEDNLDLQIVYCLPPYLPSTLHMFIPPPHPRMKCTMQLVISSLLS